MNIFRNFTLTVSLALFTLSSNAGVLMQAFYWDHPAGGVWYDNVNDKVEAWNDAGITAIWLPPVSKAQNGEYSMGYDPYDYFDLGEFNQSGSVETRHGSKAELQNLINNAHDKGMQVYADIVINHSSGGASEANPFTGTNTWTSFSHPHGKFSRSASDFHPNDEKQYDEGAFGGFPDVAHEKSNVQDWLWRRSDSVAEYYKQIGFDGWRFDYVKGFGGWVVKEWVNHAGGFAVGEYWDGSRDLINNWVNDSGASAFDFPLYYSMRDAFGQRNMNLLNGAGFAAWNPDKAVTFVANHDTDEIFTNKLLAYVFILTHEGYPTIFYRDYEEWLDKDKLNNLIWIHENYAQGSTSNLWVDNDTYIAQRNGDTGLVVFINGSNSGHDRTVHTKWNNAELEDITGNVSGTKWTDGNGQVTLYAGANDYSVWLPIGTSGGGGNTPGNIDQLFTCYNGHTYYGQSVYAVGGHNILGNWVPEFAYKLDATNYPTWNKVINLPVNTNIEWKCLKRDENNFNQGIEWQNGSNNSFNTGTSNNNPWGSF